MLQRRGERRYTITPNDSDSDADRNVVDSLMLKCFHRGTCRVMRSRQIMDEPATACREGPVSDRLHMFAREGSVPQASPLAQARIHPVLSSSEAMEGTGGRNGSRGLIGWADGPERRFACFHSSMTTNQWNGMEKQSRGE